MPDGPWMSCCEKGNLLEALVWFRNSVLKGKANTSTWSPDGFWYIPIFSTLLGARRDNDILDYAKDITIMAPIHHQGWLRRTLKKFLKDADPPFVLQETSEDMDNILLSDSNTAGIAIWYVKLAPSTFPSGCMVLENMEEGRQLVLPEVWIHPIEENGCRIQNETFPCPSEPDQLLFEWFGCWMGNFSNETVILHNPCAARVRIGRAFMVSVLLLLVLTFACAFLVGISGGPKNLAKWSSSSDPPQ